MKKIFVVLMLIFALSSCGTNEQSHNAVKDVDEILSKIDNLILDINAQQNLNVDDIIKQIDLIKVEVSNLIYEDFPEKELLADKIDELDLVKESISEEKN